MGPSLRVAGPSILVLPILVLRARPVHAPIESGKRDQSQHIVPTIYVSSSRPGPRPRESTQPAGLVTTGSSQRQPQPQRKRATPANGRENQRQARPTCLSDRQIASRGSPSTQNSQTRRGLSDPSRRPHRVRSSPFGSPENVAARFSPQSGSSHFIVEFATRFCCTAEASSGGHRIEWVEKQVD